MNEIIWANAGKIGGDGDNRVLSREGLVHALIQPEAALEGKLPVLTALHSGHHAEEAADRVSALGQLGGGHRFE